MRIVARLLCGLWVLTLLISCGGGGGGGGGGSGDTASVPTFTSQPVAVGIPAGGTGTATVAATGNGTLSYQWYVNVGPCPTCGAVSGATGPTLTLTGMNASIAGNYYCVVTNTLNGTSKTATSKSVYISVIAPTISASITAGSYSLPNTPGYTASIPAQAGVSYSWTISNATITAGQGTSQITFTSGSLGPLQIAVTVGSAATGTVVGVKNLFVVAALPVVSIFAQSSVLPGATGVLASVPAAPGGTYAWSLLSGTAMGTVSGATNTDTLTYGLGATTGSYQLSVNLTDGVGNLGSAVQTFSVVQGAFLKDVRDMAQRSLHTATLLVDGRVLFAGGDAGVPNPYPTGSAIPAAGSESNIVATAELFDPVTGTWAMVGSLSVARYGHVAALLNDGRVLVAGGADGTGSALSSSEIYNPASRTWTLGPPMSAARTLASATVLADGRVLVTGGASGTSILSSAEIYDPVANSWSSTGAMVNARVLHSLTRLGVGQVLAVGGAPDNTVTELYNPVTNSWQAAAPVPGGASGQGAVLLPSGKLLQLPGVIYDPATNSWAQSALPAPDPVVTQNTGFNAGTAILMANGNVFAATGTSAAIYDPIMQSWTLVSVPSSNAPTGGSWGSVTALQDGRVLSDGGFTSVATNPYYSLLNYASVSATAIYDPTQSAWTVGGSNAHSSYYAASGVLTDGQLLVSGGSTSQNQYAVTATTAASLFNPTTNQWTAAASMSTARQQHTATALQNGLLLVTGGNNNATVWSSSELYNPATNAWSAAGTMSSPRFDHTASLLNSGLVLVAGGNNLDGTCSCTTFVASADLYNPATNSFSATGALATARYSHTATVLANGMVLVAGGFGGPTSTLQSGGAALASAELYDPASGTWAATGPMTTTRMNHTAIRLPSGKVLVAGGNTGTAATASAEVYDPGSGTWSAVASMTVPRQSQRAIGLANGTVLVVGGLNDTSSAVVGVGSSEIYNPTGNTWTPSGSMTTTRQFFILNQLGDGRILLDGGLPNGEGLPEFYK